MVALGDVTEALGIEQARLEPTRRGDEDSVRNGNWHLWTSDGEHHILRRYHLLRTEEDLTYEAQVLDRLTACGWCVPARIAGPIQYDGRLWAVTRFVPGQPRQNETAAQQTERGEVLARMHADLSDVDLGSRPGFFQAADLDAMGDFQGWDGGVELLREQRPDLADRAAHAMDGAKELVREHDLLGLPQTIVHGDFASWNLHFDDDDRLAGVIDFDLCHPDSRVWELVIARAQPDMLTGYQRAAVEPLTEHELAAIEPLRVVFRVLMVMAELWNGRQAGRFDEVLIARQLAAIRS
ncbi:homoserine kinase type II [Kribbella sp. VKM Ac-2569]|uniref:phosphotransferase enzyme family protein n=1 Tax=Kribbella sp. VKM Ac-2569 TaxID=2512220 RepID=UPI0010E4F8C9|nr:phosphotransferase [Kribbella sp. VKM Ac-2569]RZT27273.1 homoserine kinase type II [Kribbella sp. VKM Ac-2569]